MFIKAFEMSEGISGGGHDENDGNELKQHAGKTKERRPPYDCLISLE